MFANQCRIVTMLLFLLLTDMCMQPAFSVAEYIYCTQCMPKAKAKKKRHSQVTLPLLMH